MAGAKAIAYYLVLAVASLMSFFSIYINFIEAYQRSNGTLTAMAQLSWLSGSAASVYCLLAGIYYMAMSILMARYLFSNRRARAFVVAIVITGSFMLQLFVEGMYIYYSRV